MKKGNPAAAIAILACIFGAAGVVSVLPDAQGDEFLPPRVLPSRAIAVIAEVPSTVIATAPFVERRATPTPILEVQAVNVPAPDPRFPDPRLPAPGSRFPDTLTLPLHFSEDAGPPPALAATPLTFISAAASPVITEPAIQDDRRPGTMPAAFDRTGSALAIAFRKTGAGVKTAFSVFTP